MLPPATGHGSSSAVKTVWGQSRRAPARLASTTWCSSTSPSGPGWDSSLASSVTLATSWPSSATWATTRSSTSRRSGSGKPGSAASISALSRRLVSGVRSSWLASLTSCRWAVSDRCSAPSMVLNDAASRPSSSARCTSTRRPGSPVAVTSSATAASRPTGASPARATAQPASAASPTPITLSRARVVPTLVTSWSTVASGTASCTARPGASGVVYTMARTPSSLLTA